MTAQTQNNRAVLTISQLAERWQTSESTIKKMITRGTLRAVDLNIGGPVRIVRVPLAAVEAAENGLTIQPAAPRRSRPDEWDGISAEVREIVEGAGRRRKKG